MSDHASSSRVLELDFGLDGAVGAGAAFAGALRRVLPATFPAACATRIVGAKDLAPALLPPRDPTIRDARPMTTTIPPAAIDIAPRNDLNSQKVRPDDVWGIVIILCGSAVF